MLMATWSGESVEEWPNLRVVIRGDEAPVVNPLAAVKASKEEVDLEGEREEEKEGKR